eukprot:TRINITY_DN8451_c0_g1_i1.p1 TRINITY_DN8451_c0_g1~~TRINITY_DN8451_c0_g1_i1.p1  ORF type:complete len:121 (-),score=31.89 TRINITY_DN8451_c0_g1_i1:43-405(-)
MATKCKRCTFEIPADDSYSITAFDGHFHKDCFKCNDCQTQLFSISKFFEKDGFPQCRDCKNKKGPKCNGCGSEIAEVDHITHGPLHFCKMECMKCSVCKKNVKQGDYFEDEGELFHLACL